MLWPVGLFRILPIPEGPLKRTKKARLTEARQTTRCYNLYQTTSHSSREKILSKTIRQCPLVPT